MDSQKAAEVFQYHQRSKHHPHRYARSPGYMDWDNQPTPFRFYEGAVPLRLPLLKTDPQGDHLDLYRRRDRGPQDLTLESLAGFLELSLGLSAWKAVSGNKWALRMNPSSGNLHPTEAYVVLPEMEGVECGSYHYNPFLHALEPRCRLDHKTWESVGRQFQAGCFFIALSSIFWRESWKYGERAYRYCQHDIGHAIACLSFSGNLFGWRVTCLNAASDRELERVLGFDRTDFPDSEDERAELMCAVHDHRLSDIPRALPDPLVAALQEADCTGAPNRLSRSAVDWKVIRRIADGTRKPQTDKRSYHFGNPDYVKGTSASLSAAQLIRKRRSALAFDPDGFLDSDCFLAMLDKTLPRDQGAPFDVEIMEPCIDLLLFVHGVRGLAKGLYFFWRSASRLEDLKARLNPEFVWQTPSEKSPLFLLLENDYRQTAKMVSCGQEIAGSGVFSLGMIARFRDVVAQTPYRYRHLFWEAGMLGQILYLEAEAAGLRGTGIGCFFDDEVHALMGLESDRYQSLYHFTVGAPREDGRLQTLAPYHHLESPYGRFAS